MEFYNRSYLTPNRKVLIRRIKSPFSFINVLFSRIILYFSAKNAFYEMLSLSYRT